MTGLRMLTRIAAAIALLSASGAAAQSNVFLSPDMDTAPYSAFPSLIRGGNPTIYAFEAFTEEGADHFFQTFLHFDVSLADIPQGEVLDRAFLIVTHSIATSSFGEGGDGEAIVECAEVLTPWDEFAMTWENRPLASLGEIGPAFDSDVVPPIGTDPGNPLGFGSLVCDATTIVERWIYGIYPNDGFVVTNTTDRIVGFYSREATSQPVSIRPQLALTTVVPEPGFGLSLALGTLALATGRARRRPRATHATELVR